MLTEMTSRKFVNELREICERAYARKSPDDNPIRRLVRGELTRREAQSFFCPRWVNVLILSQYVLPRLIETCPDVTARSVLWRAVLPEYGGGDPKAAHPTLYRNFLVALGCERSAYAPVLPENEPELTERIAQIERRDWLESLGHFMGRETVGPRVFGAIAAHLRTSFNLQEDDVCFFAVHAAQDVEDSETMFALAERYGTADDSRARLLRGLTSYFDFEVNYCCDLTH
jgi:pyrroloquinoline quinone (PQQ) biosynthesis protein C